ncbi:MAG: hypothetical protein HUN04_15485 [Desulfobacter sp.]|nr:MAG: hypothetical protein HUN04_15485 [Desulfobacter sp.]
MKIGIDVGSTGIKMVFVSPETRILWKKVTPTRPGQSGVVEALIREGLKDLSAGPDDIEKTCVTGYGRNLIPDSDHVVDEITANAAGIHFLTQGRARTLINIGGQDVKIISLSREGRVTDFRMNDKCAAGTGRFFEMAARILDTPLDDFAADEGTAPAAINATCAVFAESEIVSLMAQDVAKGAIIQGINNAVARRIANLAGASPLEEAVFADGGPAMNQGLIYSLEDALLCDIHVTEAPQFTVALGAVLAA